MHLVKSRNTQVVPPFVEPAGDRSLQAFDLRFQSGVLDDLAPPPQPVLQTISYKMPVSIEACGSSRGDTWE